MADPWIVTTLLPVLLIAQLLPMGGKPDWLRMRTPERPAARGDRVRAWRATLEIGAAMLAGVAWYWNNQSLNSEDWQMKWDEASWRKKIVTFEAVRFDTNGFYVNTVYHPWGHALIYGLSRSNEIGPAPSFLITTAASTSWEYLVEFRELVSLNDLVMSPIGGMGIGETLVQLGDFFARSRPTPAHEFLSALANPPGYAHRVVDRRATGPPPWDAAGLPTDVWHRFDVAAGVAGPASDARDRPREIDLSLETQIVKAAGFGHPGVFSRRLHAGGVTHLQLGTALDRNRVRRFHLFAETMLVGAHAQHIRRDGDGGWHGGRALAGLASAFEHELRNYADGTYDQLGFAHALGPVVDAAWHLGHVTLAVDADSFAGMALVRSQAFPLFLLTHPVADPETVRGALIDHGYYYAWHVSPRVRTTVAWGGAEAGLGWRHDVFESIDGLDRRQDTIVHDVHLADRRTVRELFGAYRLPRSRVRLLVTLEDWQRQGRTDAQTYGTEDTRGLVSLGGVL